MIACFSKANRESFLAKRATVLHNVVTHMYSCIFCHICCIPLMRSKSQVPSILKGKGSHKAWAPGSWDQGDHFGVYVPQLENYKMYMNSKVGWNPKSDIIPKQAHVQTFQQGKHPVLHFRKCRHLYSSVFKPGRYPWLFALSSQPTPNPIHQ